jgi:hypothetical protein
MKSVKIGLGMLAVMASAVLPASAIQYTLDMGNMVVSGYPSPYATVDVTLTDSTHATITFTGTTTGGYTYVFGANGALDVNVNASSFSVGSYTGMTSPSASIGSANISSFGKFNLSIDNFGGASNSGSPMSFVVTDLSGTWASAANVLAADNAGYLAAAHIFIYDATGKNITTGYAGNGGVIQTPDGGMTAMMLGSALTGLGLIRRKFKK